MGVRGSAVLGARGAGAAGVASGLVAAGPELESGRGWARGVLGACWPVPSWTEKRLLKSGG